MNDKNTTNLGGAKPIITAVVLTAIAVGGGMYGWHRSVVGNIQSQIADLAKQVDSASQKADILSGFGGGNGDKAIAGTNSDKEALAKVGYRSLVCPGGQPVPAVDQAVFGDLTGDGTSDSAVPLETECGNGSLFTELAFVSDWDGKLQNIATGLIGDRIKFEKAEIKNGIAIVTAKIHAPNDALDNPTEERVMRFQLTDQGLVQF